MKERPPYPNAYKLRTSSYDSTDEDRQYSPSAASPTDFLLPFHGGSPSSKASYFIPRSIARTGFFVFVAVAVTYSGWRVTSSWGAEGGLASQATAAMALGPVFNTAKWLVDPTSDNTGCIPFSLSPFSAILPIRQLLPSTSADVSDSCLDLWVSQSKLCDELEGFWKDRERAVDFIWTWTNGSSGEQKMNAWRTWAREAVTVEEPSGSGTVDVTPNHFREHDELRYSIRSALAAFPPKTIRNMHLVVGDTSSCYPDEVDCDGDLRQAQIPHWLNLSAIGFAAGENTEEQKEPGFRVRPHWEIFKSRPELELDEDEKRSPEIVAKEWRSTVVPSFNSLAIESQIINMEGLAPLTFYMNDDLFLLRYLTISDIASPLTGPVFRLQRNTFATGTPPGNVNPDGEWKSLHYANSLLDRRFGVRPRSYVMHQAKALVTGIWREAQETFMDALTRTGEARFRGLQPDEAQIGFLLVHYTIEKQREALLWSFFFGRSDIDQDGFFSPDERHTLLAEIGRTTSSSSRMITVLAPRRTTLHDFSRSYTFTGLPMPLESTPEFTAQDGYAAFEPASDYHRPVPWPAFDSRHSKESEPRPKVCEIDLDDCFGGLSWATGKGKFPVEEAFKRVAFERPQCGDCIIAALLGKATRGLEAFLPSPSSGPSSYPSPPLTEAVGLSPTYHTSFLLPPTSSPRTRCVRLIQRYPYIVGNSQSLFMSILGLKSLQETFERFDRPNGKPAFLAMNDDMGPDGEDGVDKAFAEWFDRQLPEKSPWEL